MSLSLFSLLMLAISVVGYRYYAKPGRFYEQMGGMSVVPGADGMFGETSREGAGIRVLRIVGEKVPVSPEDATITRRLLLAAGYRSDQALAVFLGLRILTAGGGLALGLTFHAMLTDNTILRLLIISGGAMIGWVLPGLALEMLVSSRQERIKFALPDALDLLAVCVEAGLGLDQALVNVGRELKTTHPDVSDELSLVTLEINAGSKRAGRASESVGTHAGK